jgi:hypothetical protein
MPSEPQSPFSTLLKEGAFFKFAMQILKLDELKGN